MKEDRSANKPFAVFDIDGTLIRWQLYHAVVDKLAASGALGKDAKENLKNARMIWKKRQRPTAFKEYEMVVVETYEAAFSSLDVASFDAMVQEVIEEYKDQVYTYTRDLIAKLKKDGYTLLAISGSHTELVQEIAKYYGFDDFVGTKYARESGKFSGMEFLANKDKKAVLQGLIEKHNLNLTGSIAVGDSKSDASMLEVVEMPIAFNPDQELLKIARAKGWKIVIERKNVVYELSKDSNGKFVLSE